MKQGRLKNYIVKPEEQRLSHELHSRQTFTKEFQHPSSEGPSSYKLSIIVRKPECSEKASNVGEEHLQNFYISGKHKS